MAKIIGNVVGMPSPPQETGDAIWDELQNYGNRENYPSGFFSEYNGETLSPKHVVAPTGVCSKLFENGKMKYIDKDKFDLSKATYSTKTDNSTTTDICKGCKNLEIFPDIGLQAGSISNGFDGCESLHTIEKLRFRDSPVDMFTFGSCKKLVNIEDVEGTIAEGAYFMYSPLSIDSLKKIITHMKNYSGTDEEYEWEAWFDYDALDALDTEGGPSPNGNKWSEYIDDLGWWLL